MKPKKLVLLKIWTVHASLEKGEKLLSERQKRIILADKSDCDWSLIREYRKKRSCGGFRDKEKKIIRAEARVRTQARRNLTRNGNRLASSRREPTASASVTATTSPCYNDSTPRHISTIQATAQPERGVCFVCNKPGHWRAQYPLNSSKFQSGL